MTDKELLELAAKAAGIKLADPVNSHIPSGGVWIVTEQSNRDRVWDPLNNDGDALRLAVSLRLVITVGACNVEARRWTGGDGDMEPMHCQVVAQGGDPYAATRRAIVRAAAEMGRDKP